VKHDPTFPRMIVQRGRISKSRLMYVHSQSIASIDRDRRKL